ncbi:MAG: hypothetical protein KIT22_16885, partial [Verrucomicrobiae bacterium]|nr:hypothetical protein [Verrucomicrobiae bacterium]
MRFLRSLFALGFGLAATAAQPKWEQMDYGSFLASSVTMPWSKNGEDVDGITLKGLTLRFGTNGAACFDTSELRWAGAWTGGWLKLMGTPFDGTHRPPEGSRPAVAGVPIFGTSHGPGWARDGDWRDPRTEPYVPLPREWAQWRGFYLSADGTPVLSYTVGDTAMLEKPALEEREGVTAFSRTLAIEDHPQTLAVLVAELRLELRDHVATVGLPAETAQGLQSFGPLTVAAEGLPADARWEVLQGSRLVLHLPPAREPVALKLSVAKTTPERMRRFAGGDASRPASLAPAAMSEMIRPGGTPFPEVITTAGRLGNTGGAYEVDSLPLPDDNPWHAWMRPSGFDFFSDGARAALCTWSGDVWIVSGLDDSLARLEWRRFASGLFQPLGLKIVKDQIYVLGRDQITRLQDRNGDGGADFYECFNNGVSVTPNFHEFALDLQADAAGNFYFTKGGPLLGTDYWDPIGAHNGCVLKVSADGRTLERLATGLRAPNGTGLGPRGEVTCSDNEGIWTPVCRLNWVQPGGFYGSLGLDHRTPPPTTYDPPLCWLPFAMDNSAGGQVWAGDQFGPLSGELIHLSYGKCRAFHVLKQEIGGRVQGGIVPLPWKFDSAAMRGRVNPRDGSLWVAGLKGWQTTSVRDGALHRVRHTGAPFPRLTGLAVQREGIELRFNTAVDRTAAADLQNWDVQEWDYLWSDHYGSDLYSVSEPGRVVGKKGELKGDPVA